MPNNARVVLFVAIPLRICQQPNTILKELSGAAVTPQEYERLKTTQPGGPAFSTVTIR